METPRPPEALAQIKTAISPEVVHVLRGEPINPANIPTIIDGLHYLNQQNAIDPEVTRWLRPLGTSQDLTVAILQGFETAVNDPQELRKFATVGHLIGMSARYPDIFQEIYQHLQTLEAQAATAATPTATTEQSRPTGRTPGNYVDHLIDTVKGALGPAAGWAGRKLDQAFPDTGNMFAVPGQQPARPQPATPTTPPATPTEPATEPEPTRISAVEESREEYEARIRNMSNKERADFVRQDPEKLPEVLEILDPGNPTAQELREARQGTPPIRTAEARVVEPTGPSTQALREARQGTPEGAYDGGTETEEVETSQAQDVVQQAIDTYGGRDEAIEHYKGVFASPPIPEARKIADDMLAKLGVPGHPEPPPARPAPSPVPSEPEQGDAEKKPAIVEALFEEPRTAQNAYVQSLAEKASLKFEFDDSGIPYLVPSKPRPRPMNPQQMQTLAEDPNFLNVLPLRIEENEAADSGEERLSDEEQRKTDKLADVVREIMERTGMTEEQALNFVIDVSL